MKYGDSVSKKIIDTTVGTIDLIYSIFGSHRKYKLLIDLANKLIPVEDVKIPGQSVMKLYSPSLDTKFRADKFFIKEPETIKWIDTFTDEDVFWDIGANIGVYSIYAALTKKMKVLSFEPSFANYWILNNNIKLNNLHGCVTAYCIAMTNEMMIGKFNMADTDMGGACYHFGKEVSSFMYAGVEEKKVLYTQGMIGLSVEDAIFKFNQPFPTHIKIDVDGIEEQILDGALIVLADDRFKSLSVEFDERLIDVVERVTNKLNGCGLSLLKKEHSPEIDADEDSKHSYNYLFAKRGYSL